MIDLKVTPVLPEKTGDVIISWVHSALVNSPDKDKFLEAATKDVKAELQRIAGIYFDAGREYERLMMRQGEKS